MNPDQQLNPQELQRLNEALSVTADAIRRVAPHLGGQLGSLFGQPQSGGQFGAAGVGQSPVAHQIAEAVRAALVEQSGGQWQGAAWQQGGNYPLVERIVEGIRNALASGQNPGMGAMGGLGQMGLGQTGYGQSGSGAMSGANPMGGHMIVERIVEALRNSLGQTSQASGFGGTGHPIVERIIDTLRSTLAQSGQMGGYGPQAGGYNAQFGGFGSPMGYNPTGGYGWGMGGGHPVVDRIVDAIRASLTQSQPMAGSMFGPTSPGGFSPFVNLQQRGI